MSYRQITFTERGSVPKIIGLLKFQNTPKPQFFDLLTFILSPAHRFLPSKTQTLFVMIISGAQLGIKKKPGCYTQQQDMTYGFFFLDVNIFFSGRIKVETPPPQVSQNGARI